MLRNEKKIRFVRAFVSPVFGNVWMGREVTIQQKQAMRFVELGLAEEVKAENGRRGNSSGSKASPSGDAE